MSKKLDYEKKQFEVQFLKEFAALTRFPQALALKMAREQVEDILIMFNDGCTPRETAKYVAGLLDVEHVKASAYSGQLHAHWR